MSVVRKYQDAPAASVHALPGSKREAAPRLLGEELRQMRLGLGLTLREVAPVIRASVSKLSRLERGESPPRERDVKDLARHYGAGPEKMQELDSLLRLMHDDAWWQQYADVTPSFLRRLIGLEGAARKIYTYENHVVPGLLQTRDYARVLVEAAMPSADPEVVERRVELKMGRKALLRQEHRPQVIALLDEGILLRPVGGARVMWEQLTYLREIAEEHLTGEQNVNIRIVGFARGASVSPPTPITHLLFGDGGPAELVYIEQVDSANYVTKPLEVDRYRHVLAEVSGVAATRRQSLELLDRAIERYRAASADG
ncbi:helix-turn-helix transcriptional regulator [Streptomyces sp. NPDC050610]|uniref:helix-turn-helix domain-containing protein n=1 Tax=Streptomyces sp. NPDC050610 TaxID=3157097 RepID=UPI00342A5C8F